jgi:hypothetical protein
LFPELMQEFDVFQDHTANFIVATREWPVE